MSRRLNGPVPGTTGPSSIQLPDPVIQRGGEAYPPQIGDEQQACPPVDPPEQPEREDDSQPEYCDDDQSEKRRLQAEERGRPGHVDDGVGPEHTQGQQGTSRPPLATSRALVDADGPPDQPDGDPHQGEEGNPDRAEHPVRRRKLRPGERGVPAVEALDRKQRPQYSQTFDREDGDHEREVRPLPAEPDPAWCVGGHGVSSAAAAMYLGPGNASPQVGAPCRGANATTPMPEEPDITELDARTVERIAAGEVVERPASVVKELVENAIDADASRVDVTVEGGGTEGVRVADDGLGMTQPEVERAVEKHTTSKISDIDDLESGVATLGFRGEALHAIGAVSRLTVRTRPRSDRNVAADAGTELVVEGGDVTDVGPAGCPEGTTVEVADLFYNVPARRKYLKQASTEFAHVNTVVTSYALANPDVAVSLTHGDRETFATTGAGDLQETVMEVYGREVAQAMIPVEPNELPDGPLDGISGLVSHPETNRASRDYLSTFVNGRYVTAASVREAVVDAYDTQLAPDRYPFAVLDLSVDAGTVDVNVHPRKLEVRFADEAGVRNQVEAAVSAALMREGLIRTAAPRGQSAPDETEIRPGDDGSGRAPGWATEADTAASTDDHQSEDGPADPPTRPGPRVDADSVRGGRVGGDSSRSTEGSASGADDATEAGTTEGSGSTVSEAPESVGGSTVDSHRKFRGGTDQARLGEAGTGGEAGMGGEAGASSEADVEASEPQTFDALPAMRILGQLHETYVVAETDEGLVLVDQHAADERINYERLRAELEGDTPTQALADPVELELTAGEAALFDDRAEALASLGFQAERVDDRTVRVATVPSLVAEAADPELLRDVLGALVEGEGEAAATVEAAADDLLADLACYPSITGNTSLSEGSVLDLLDRLDGCENPYACPHGRPVVIELDRGELEARFERDYPGHGG